MNHNNGNHHRVKNHSSTEQVLKYFEVTIRTIITFLEFFQYL